MCFTRDDWYSYYLFPCGVFLAAPSLFLKSFPIVMKPTQILRALRSIKWRYSTHHSKDGRRPEAERLVHQHYEKRCLEKRNVEQAEIVYDCSKSTGHFQLTDHQTDPLSMGGTATPKSTLLLNSRMRTVGT